MSCALCGTAGAIGDFPLLLGQCSSIPKHLLTTNVPPLDSQIPVLQQILSDSQASVGVLNARIADLRAALTRLVRERDDLVVTGMKCKEALAPVRRIPPELVIEILSRICCTRMIKDGERGERVKQPPWRLTHICKSWRQTAIGSPLLWRSFTIVHGLGQNFHRPPFSAAMIQAQLSRTGRVPLHIHYQWRDHGHYRQFGEEAWIWNLLLPHSNRWQTLYIRCSSWELALRLDAFLQPIKDRLSRLIKVEFIVDADHRVWNRWDLFSAAPRLSSVLLTSSTHSQYSPDVVVPWSQITRYRGCYSTAEQLKILRSCTHLVECSIRFIKSSRARDDTPVVLPLLLRLHVASSEVLTHITAPILEELLIQDVAPTLTPFLERSSCHLSTLILTNLLSIDDLIPFLAVCSTLEHFTFILDAHSKVTVGSMSTLFKALALQTPPTQTNDICPGLTSLTFGWWSLRGSSWKDAFFAMIRSRVHRLRVIRILSLRVGGNDFADALRQQIGQLNRTGSPFDAKQLNGRKAQVSWMGFSVFS
ncbi:hypothetical protein FB45DRAFT_1060397 [Roridomyces roridus]|uniref:F-box domain-containing protein n=1 Tax=Roridomyces roridus TaxID=1738132 RepID=A0AAD7FKW2_9AGAR|nr:hypothetical protein FB45DRAFT_1060397 [Roridomyces roridus]